MSTTLAEQSPTASQPSPPPLPPPPPPLPPPPLSKPLTENVTQQAQFATTTQQQTIVQVRDRLFHALFYRISLMYARKFTKTFRRLIEFFVLMLALTSFVLLSYLHVVFNRNPVNCLAPIQDKWPRDGVLRVEIVYNASQLFLMSYDELAEAENDGASNRTSIQKANGYSLKGRLHFFNESA